MNDRRPADGANTAVAAAAGTPKRRRRWARRAAWAGALVAGWVYVVAAPRGPVGAAGAATLLSTFREEVDSTGQRVARLDDAAWRQVCLELGLPDPPNVNGADPVPVRLLLELVCAWSERRSTATLGQLGRIYQALELHHPALCCFAAASAMEPTNALWRYCLGAECQAVGLSDAAARELEKAAAMDPNYATTYARLGALALERNDAESAGRWYRAYLHLRPGESLGHVGLGRAALAAGMPEAAVAHLHDAVRVTPNDFQARRFLSRALGACGRAEEARQQAAAAEHLPRYSGWLTFDPRLQEAHSLANSQRYLENRLRQTADAGDYAACIATAEQLLRRRPGDFQTLGNLASVYRKVGRLEEAERTIDRALGLKPDSPGVLCIRAEIAFARKDYAAVHALLDAVTRLDPRNARAHDVRARTLFLQSRGDEALAAMGRAIQIEPHNVSLRLTLAEMQRRLGYAADAERELRAVLEIDPSNAAAVRMLAQLGGAAPGAESP